MRIFNNGLHCREGEAFSLTSPDNLARGEGHVSERRRSFKSRYVERPSE